jgi:YD repeat-containing protein
VTSRTLTWAAGKLAAVTYADGRSKAMTYTGEQLTRVDRLTPGQTTQRADLAYNPDGTLAGITESVI